MKRSVIIAAAWAVLVVVLAGLLWLMRGRDGLGESIDGSGQSLLPSIHRSTSDDGDEARYYVLLEAQNTAAVANLGPAALSIAQVLGDERVVLAPPNNAVADWLDQHGLYLVPTDEHEALKGRRA